MPHSHTKSKLCFAHIFGPVYSWRLGYSLGIDPLSAKEKVCNYDCIYCQLGRTGQLSRRRRIFVPVREMIREVRRLPPMKIDYITFSGRGEPTLAKNLGRMIKAVRKIRPGKIAVITNGSLLYQKRVRQDLMQTDFVLVKLDACDDMFWRKINHPVGGIGYKHMLAGIKIFRRQYKGRFGLQIMLMDMNRTAVGCLADLARLLRPDEVQLNTPLRQSPVAPLSRPLMLELARIFKRCRVRMVYQVKRKKVKPLNVKATRYRHGKESL